MKIDVNKENVIRITEIYNSIEIEPNGGKCIAVRTRNGKVECGVIEDKDGLSVVKGWYTIEDTLPTFIDWKDLVKEAEEENFEHICCSGPESEHICCCDENFNESPDED